MKSRVHKIEIQNFKAFREFSLNLEGRHLLLYGPNGSGKSSIYWALYTFLQSAQKPTSDVAKYFDPTKNQKLLNIHEDPVGKPGEISLTMRETGSTSDVTFCISQTVHETQNQPLVIKGDLASDFISYRFFFGFSDFRNSEDFNIWPLFEKEILPFCVATGGQDPLECWKQIREGDPNPGRLTGFGGTNAYTAFKNKTKDFADILPSIVDLISIEAQKFYDKHFAEEDKVKVNLVIKVTKLPAASGSSWKDFEFTRPSVEFGVKFGETAIANPQAFLNEAKLTQLALAVRFSASMVNLHESDIKLLILDDLLVSLDMDNRMKVVDIILSDTFENYQKIILTHDRGFFEEFRRIVGDNHSEWCFRSLQGNPKDGISIIEKKSAIEKAQDYLEGHDLEEAALQLRKAAEDTAKKFRKVAMKELPSPGEFHSLSEDLNAVKNHLSADLPIRFYKNALNGIPENHREKLISVTDDDIDSDATLTPEEKGRIKCQRKSLKGFLTDQAWKNLEIIETVDAVIQMKNRILNPAAHWNEAPLYEREVKKALRLIQRLESTLLP